MAQNGSHEDPCVEARSGKPVIVVIRNFSRDGTDTDMWIGSLEANFGDRRRVWTREGWDMLLSESQVCADLPVFHSLARRNLSRGQAVMLNRDPETWYESVLSSAYPSFLATVQVRRRTRPLLRLTSQSYKNIRDSIPEERRLEFAAQDGYGPLCEFLAVPVTIVNDERTNEVVVDRDSFGSLFSMIDAEKQKGDAQCVQCYLVGRDSVTSCTSIGQPRAKSDTVDGHDLTTV
ncbi:hypothetical protein MHUMG1_03927 [Metarhizium humberi]|uniref:Uncharacterized protein n=1 Tax=Metarhizium humberi TaxID=2596975 RepID=A0A9P8S9S9_9HYPO|nr:hypothetical protein MHUMG1_03927 [Metarhizium humberi]